MGLFSKILEKLGIKRRRKKQNLRRPPPNPPTPSPPRKPPPLEPGCAPRLQRRKPRRNRRSQIRPVSVSVVDVVAQLEAKAKGKDLNWKVSIVDLLKLLDLDSSREAREELAKELGCPPIR